METILPKTFDVNTLRSVNAEVPAPDVSSKYVFIPTKEIVTAMQAQGFIPVRGSERKSKTYSGKHTVAFRHPSMANTKLLSVGDAVPEIIVSNSHDRSSGITLHAGLFRLVCSNGLVVSSGSFGHFRIRHVNTTVNRVLEMADQIIGKTRELTEVVAEMRGLEMTRDRQLQLADMAAALRFPDGSPVNVESLLTPRRELDLGSDLWTVFNRVQENVIRGGLQGQSVTGRRQTTRAINSTERGMGLNQGLWDAAVSFLPKAA